MAFPYTKALVPGVLQETAADAVDLFEELRIGNVNLFWRNSHDMAVSLMQGMDVMQAATGDDVVLQNEMRELSIPWSGDPAKGRAKNTDNAQNERSASCESNLKGNVRKTHNESIEY